MICSDVQILSLTYVQRLSQSFLVAAAVIASGLHYPVQYKNYRFTFQTSRCNTKVEDGSNNIIWSCIAVFLYHHGYLKRLAKILTSSTQINQVGATLSISPWVAMMQLFLEEEHQSRSILTSCGVLERDSRTTLERLLW